jgi:hypothetical protein
MPFGPVRSRSSHTSSTIPPWIISSGASIWRDRDFPRIPASTFYYLGDYRSQAPYFSGVESEVRHTFGSRTYGKIGDFDFDFERGWHSQPVSSGGRTIGTFNALFPRGNYFSEPSPIGEQNIVALHPQINWYPTPKLGLWFTPILYWRQSMDDGIYNFAGDPLSGGGPDSGRYVGTELFFQADYQVSEQLKISLAYDHFFHWQLLRRATWSRRLRLDRCLGNVKILN